MLSCDGLKALCGLASGRFGRFIETLRIGSEALAYSRPTATRAQRARLRELYEDQTYLRQRGLDAALLAVALTNMKASLREIVVSGASSIGGPRSWGALELEEEVGGAIVLEQSRTLSTVLAAIASSQVQPRVVRNEPLIGKDGIGAHRDAIAIPRAGMALLSAAFQRLRILQLNLWVQSTASGITVRSLSADLIDLLLELASLEELYLGLQRVLAVPVLGPEIGAVAFSSRLRKLHITGGQVEEATLLALIQNHRQTLQRATFTRVSLRGGWRSLLGRLGFEVSSGDLEANIQPAVTVLGAWDSLACQEVTMVAGDPSKPSTARRDTGQR
ncbi:uncharacterized protein LTHEOB_13032 [Lasiodiplodia theobromae]|uniref:uncharacterized protein n=1 Tax=Lasiodiplodia theobromae TaxID=45133 RepID=UPI0015C3381D|nr:uncharacterized protein LTHEOB_13032 [Lasiodiplodia theobromae]KAF4546823.1 hypothetical protein LTHEOB_13032 [Lasiodiplodia theobromae]